MKPAVTWQAKYLPLLSFITYTSLLLTCADNSSFTLIYHPYPPYLCPPHPLTHIWWAPVHLRKFSSALIASLRARILAITYGGDIGLLSLRCSFLEVVLASLDTLQLKDRLSFAILILAQCWQVLSSFLAFPILASHTAVGATSFRNYISLTVRQFGALRSFGFALTSGSVSK